MPKKPNPVIEYVYTEPQTEAERADAQRRVDRALDVILEHLLTKYRARKQSENQT